MNALLLLALLLPSTHARDDSSAKRKIANASTKAPAHPQPAHKKKSTAPAPSKPAAKPATKRVPAPKRVTAPVPAPPPPAPVATQPAVEPSVSEETESAVDLSSGAVVGEGEEISLDLGSDADSFNPYLFDRSQYWLLLPVLTLFLLGLHLLPVPRRGGTRKRMEADHFFSDLKQNQKSGSQPPKEGA